jgi:hypothetical protein
MTNQEMEMTWFLLLSAQPLYVASGLNSKPILRFYCKVLKNILIFLPLLGCVYKTNRS